uniref:Uncharacterized protein n=1 Tax=Anopheles atroparvus TaxID=41427 RepID=A0A182J2T6_ANOAO
MADCSYARCVQERRYIRRELAKWTKNMVHIVVVLLLLYLVTFLSSPSSACTPERRASAAMGCRFAQATGFRFRTTKTTTNGDYGYDDDDDYDDDVDYEANDDEGKAPAGRNTDSFGVR